jgi:uncharacterized oxidoreductase
VPTFSQADLKAFTSKVFLAYGVPADVAQVVADSLVVAELKGHSSHGLIRIIDYVDWLGRGWINPMGKLKILKDQGVILAVEGDYQFGQVIGRQAVELALEKVREHGVSVLTIRRTAHLGRMGEWMEMATQRGYLGFGFTNTHGAGVMVAPFGGRERRLSANPLVAGAPVAGGADMIMDIATCMVAEGKVKVAKEKGTKLPVGSMVNGRGEPSIEPADYFGDPPGALLPFGGHKGYALSMFCEVFAGILSGGACSGTQSDRIANGFFAVFVDPKAFCTGDYDGQFSNLIQWVKSSKPMQGFTEILLVGEPEGREHEKRQREGIPVPEPIWKKICQIAEQRQVAPPRLR